MALGRPNNRFYEKKDGVSTDTRNDIILPVDGGSRVDFNVPAAVQALGTLTVTATSLPPIDISQVD